MTTSTAASEDLQALLARVEQLETRVQALESGGSTASRRSSSSSAAIGDLDSSEWTQPYEIAQLEVSETWIELHEPSARPQLQRLLRQVIEVEGPITERLALDRVRRAWGLRRAGGRVQEAFEQAVRQLIARTTVERDADALVMPGSRLERVRVPDGDDATKRAAEDVPLVELSLALRRTASALGGGVAVDELTMRVAKLFGWTRRGGAIQERLDAALQAALDGGDIEVADGRVSAVLVV
jgi:hypothetical protein